MDLAKNPELLSLLLAGVGCIVLLFVMKKMRDKRETPKSKNFLKKSVKVNEKSMQDAFDGNFEAAANREMKAGNLEAAFEMYMRAQKPERAAAVAQRMGRIREAAELYERAGDKDRAAALYRQMGNPRKAEEISGVSELPKAPSGGGVGGASASGDPQFQSATERAREIGRAHV